MSLFTRKPNTISEDEAAQLKAEAMQEAKQAIQQAIQEAVGEMRNNLLSAAQGITIDKSVLQDLSAKETAALAEESKKAIQQAIQQVVDDMVIETKTSTRTAVEQAAKLVEAKKAAEAAAAKRDPVDEAPASRPVRPIIRPHAFVVMPFGKKKGGDGSLYDFNAIYNDLIKPTLEMAGFEPFRADEATTSGDILTDMFQELLLADLVLCDLSIDNANAFYELGIRHAFRKRGVVHIQAGRSYMPFDIFNVRTIPYHITSDGVPDTNTIEKDKQAIARVCRDTWASDPDAIHSPIFNLLTGLVEPERSTLRTPLATGFWRDYNEWKNRLTIAKRRQRIGDILLLTEEITNPMIKEEALGEAGKALLDMERLDLGLQQYQAGLGINPRNLKFRRQEAILLNRLEKVEEAIVKLENLLAEYPADTEAIGTLGRIYKDMWNKSWKWLSSDKEKRLKTAYEAYHWLIKAFQTYLKGYQFDLDNTYLGVNALTLGTTLISLADKFEGDDPDPDITAIREILPELRATLLFALEHKTFDEKADYWDLASLGELQVNTADRTQKVTRAYRKALTAARGNLFSLESSMKQLETLCSLDMRTEFAQAGIQVIKDELHRIRKEDESSVDTKTASTAAAKSDGRVFLFTGYMVDYSRKSELHFPPGKEKLFTDAIDKILDEKYKVGPDDLAVIAGMSGGCELIFIERCLERKVRVKAYLPIPEAQYVRDYVSVCGDNWTERFYKARNNELCDEYYQPDNVGPVKPGDNLDERNNRWAFYSSFERGMDKLRVIAVWDGKNDFPKDRDARQVKHMVDLARDMGAKVEPINSSKILAEDAVHHISEKLKELEINSESPKPKRLSERLGNNG